MERLLFLWDVMDDWAGAGRHLAAVALERFLDGRNLDHRGIGDIDTLTVREYLDLSWRRRGSYRTRLHPHD